MDHLNLSEKQKEIFNQFCVSAADVIDSSWTQSEICKWLIARNFDINQAKSMLQKSMEWRKRIGADTVLENWNPPEVLKKYYPGGAGGVDKEGFPIWFDLASYMDFKGLLHSVQKSDIIKYEMMQIEIARKMMKTQSAKLKRPIDQMTVVMDVGQLGLKHFYTPALQLYGEVLEMTEQNYPENLKVVYIINAPRIFPAIFNILRPFLHAETQKKIHIYGSNWKDKVLQFIDEDQIPKAWGGSMVVDGDPYCKICRGGDIPDSFYLLDGDYDHMTSVTVDRGSKCKVEVKVDVPESVIRWSFKTSAYDIGFGIFFKSGTSKEKLDEVLPISKMNSHMVLQEGLHTCDKCGTYVIVFDNKYSWVHSKSLQYHIELVAPSLVEDTNKYSAEEINGDILELTKM